MCKHNLLTPYANPEGVAQNNYNRSHIRTRVTVEQLFGVWKRRFPILAYGCRIQLSTAKNVVVATAVLHNIARSQNDPEPSTGPSYNPIDELDNLPQIHEPIANGSTFRRYLTETYFNN